MPVNMDDDDNSKFDIDEENSDDDQDNYWNTRKTYTGWDYKRYFGEDALKKLYQAREAYHRNI
ncbi:9069_t:CDS:1, partial [Gigaspora margarita]